MNLNYKIPNVISLKDLRNQNPMKYGKLIKQLTNSSKKHSWEFGISKHIKRSFS